MVDLPSGQEVHGLHGFRSLFQGAILGAMWLKCLSVNEQSGHANIR